MPNPRLRLSLVSTIDRPARSAPSMQYRAGQRIAERYVLKERIGEGGMGSVWRAHHEALGCDVALKLTNCPSGPVANRLVREAQLSARISHPGVVRVFDAGVAPHGEPFVVMELLHGVDMRTWFELHGTMSPTLAVATLLPVLQALAHVHEVGIVHRDLKPENVFFANKADGGFEPKLVDFGIAWAPELSTLTSPGDALGTPAYMSPEQAAGREVRIVSDVWAFCVVLYETIEGRLPFDANNMLAQLATIANDPPAEPTFATEHPELWAIVRRGFEKDASKRWSDTRSLGRALASWLEAAGVHEDLNGHALRPTWLPVSSPDVTPLSTPRFPPRSLTPISISADTAEIQLTPLPSAFPTPMPSAFPTPVPPPLPTPIPLARVASRRKLGWRAYAPMLLLSVAGISSVPFLKDAAIDRGDPTVLALAFAEATAPRPVSASSPIPEGIEEAPALDASERPTVPAKTTVGLGGPTTSIEKTAASNPQPSALGTNHANTQASARARLRPLKDPFEK